MGPARKTRAMAARDMPSESRYGGAKASSSAARRQAVSSRKGCVRVQQVLTPDGLCAQRSHSEKRQRQMRRAAHGTDGAHDGER